MKTHTVAADFTDNGLVPPVDSADITDADAFEVLQQGDRISTETSPDQLALDESSVIPDDPMVSEIEAGILSTGSTLVVDQFPFGSPGAPIPGMPQGRSAYESHQATIGDSAWAPFQSESDWLFAHWAKMRGPTSSAVTDLLAIPEVYTSFYLHIALLTCV
jgi:hypothetical protein